MEAFIDIDSYRLKYMHSIFGRERILHNGVEKSVRYSVTGTAHRFIIGNDKFSIASKHNLFDKSIVHLEISKNGEILKKQVIKLNFEDRLPWIVVGILSGIALYQLINFLVGVI